ncbi:MAG: hypothetical protein LKI04_04365 [Paenibacillus lautus]|jgi:hypothetical protein|uniref:hypothetical protein n=1 Tax=Paenibacillus lautus TaxID=1401 RepID=UPI0026F35668|nr:hypothetical protein [Paenibacillus lautus]MCI1773213.1 hypothetical protein [Paenibacillus lautus]
MPFIQRCLYRAELIEGDIRSRFCGKRFIQAVEDAMKREQVSRLSLFADGSRLFLYYEGHGEQVRPEILLPEANSWLAVWPGGGVERRWAAMADIFHYQAPASEQHWKRRYKDSVPYGRIARLKPEETASYVYYHYQYQEERPGDGDKYGIIGLHENMLFFYSELPATLEPAPYKGKLNTSLRPDDWAAAMDPHFIKWEESPSGQEIWRELELVREVRISAERQGTKHA